MPAAIALVFSGPHPATGRPRLVNRFAQDWGTPSGKPRDLNPRHFYPCGVAVRLLIAELQSCDEWVGVPISRLVARAQEDAWDSYRQRLAEYMAGETQKVAIQLYSQLCWWTLGLWALWAQKPPDATEKPEPTPPDDAVIANQIREQFKQLEGFRLVRICSTERLNCAQETGGYVVYCEQELARQLQQLSG